MAGMTAYWASDFWKQAAERSIKTMAQTAVSLIGAGAVDIVSLNWSELASVSLGAGLVSVLTSIASTQVGKDADASAI